VGEAGALVCPECGSAYIRGVKYCAHCGTMLTGLADLDASEPLPAGTLIGGYRLVDLLGEGGMGRVYVAEHVKLGRRVAIKMLRKELVSNPVAVARFFAEARAVNRISHENIVEITDFLEQPGGDNCIIMELLKGEDLGQRLLRKRIVSLPRALDIAAQTASALAAVHSAGMIHRDLKPDNVFLIERGGSTDFVKLLDFGVAKLTDPSGQGGIVMHSTAAGQIIGTPEYMSPEQAGGQPVDFRTDVYALGVILYEMLTGVLPFQAKSFGELLIKHMTEPVKLPPSQSGLPHGVQAARDRLLLDLLAKDPGARPRSMRDIEQRMRELIDGMDLPAMPKQKRASTSGSHVPIRDKPDSVDHQRPVSRSPDTKRPSTPPPDHKLGPSPERRPTPPPEKRLTPPPDKLPTPPPETPTTNDTVARVKLQRVTLQSSAVIERGPVEVEESETGLRRPTPVPARATTRSGVDLPAAAKSSGSLPRTNTSAARLAISSTEAERLAKPAADKPITDRFARASTGNEGINRPNSETLRAERATTGQHTAISDSSVKLRGSPTGTPLIGYESGSNTAIRAQVQTLRPKPAPEPVHKSKTKLYVGGAAGALVLIAIVVRFVVHDSDSHVTPMAPAQTIPVNVPAAPSNEIGRAHV
jgi:serine/threonine protein kinase